MAEWRLLARAWLFNVETAQDGKMRCWALRDGVVMGVEVVLATLMRTLMFGAVQRVNGMGIEFGLLV